MRHKAKSRIDTHCYAVQTSHFTPAQAGEIFNLTKPRLAVIHHATVNDASREALVSDVRSTPAHLQCALFMRSHVPKVHNLQSSHNMKSACLAFAYF